MANDLAAARAALRARQGAGARYDADAAPADDLLLARRGAAFFARKLNEVHDVEFADPSRIAGRSRAHIAADVSFRARTMAIALKGMREGLTAEEEGWRPDLSLAVTLPVRAIRNLYYHSDVHLNVELRDLSDAHWQEDVKLGGAKVPVRDLPRLRARHVWLGALALGNGARPADLPAVFRDGLGEGLAAALDASPL